MTATNRRPFVFARGRDQSVFINASIASLEEHLLFGSVLAALVVFLFIRSGRSVVIAAVAIPTSIIATFTLLSVMDFTLNNMTLLALTLAVGIVIDDAIVVLENIVRYVQEKGQEPREAAIEATKEITLAVMAPTLSLVIIFLPIAFMQGYARRYVNEFGWTMAFSIPVSMLVSFTLTPMLSSRLLKRTGATPGPEGHGASGEGAKGLFGRVARAYGRVLVWSLDHRAIVLGAAFATFLLTFPLNVLVGRDWIPPDDQSELNLLLNLPEGTSLDATARTTKDIADNITKIPGVEFTNPFIHGGTASHSHIYVRLRPISARKLSNLQMADEFRKVTAQYRYLRSKVLIPSALGGGENYPPIQVRILGPDFGQAVEASKHISERMREVPGLLDVEPGVSVNSPELQVKIDRQRASDSACARATWRGPFA